MFQGSPKSMASIPAASNFRTPKPVNYRSRISARDRESGESYTSQELVSSANHSSAHSEPSAVQICHASDQSRKISLPLQATSAEQATRPRYRENDVPVSQNFDFSSNQAAQRTIAYSNPRQYLHSNDAVSENLRLKPEGSTVTRRDGFEVCPVPHGYVVGCGRMSHNSLTDADKLQQFNSLGRHSNDRYVHWPSSGQQGVFDVGQNQFVNGHRVSNGHLVPEREHHPVEYGAIEPVQHGHYAGSSYDLTAWLQQHKQNLRQQQQLSDLVSQNQLSSRGHYASTGNLVDSSEKVEILKQAADDIIRAKDSIIERQKTRIIQLETNAVKSRFSGTEYGSSNEQILEKKLGAVEYELQETKRSSEIFLKDKENTIASLKEELKGKDLIISDWNAKYSAEKSKLEQLQSEIASLNRYLSELPTVEEHSNNLSLIKSINEENLLYKEAVTQLEKKFEQLANDLQEKDSRLQFQDDSNKELEAKLRDLEAYNSDLTEKLSLRVDLLELEQLQMENRRLKTDLEKARKLMDALNNQTKQLTSKHKAEIADRSERLDQQEVTIASLQQQIRDKDLTVKNSKQNVKELSAENQNLMEQKMKLEEELKDLRQPERAEEQKLQQLLFKELNISFGDMNRLIKVCLEKVNGQDPNLALLLGIRDYSMGDEVESITHSTAAVSLNSLKSQLSQARTLRHEIDKLREIIADKFAEDMGRRLTCNPQ